MSPKDGTTVTAKDPKAPLEPLEAMDAEAGETTEAEARGHTPGQVTPGSHSITSGQSEGSQSETENHWIALELKDQDDNPIPDEHYRVKLPDGTISAGYTDADGKARIEGIPVGGQAEINFPRIHGDEWHPA